MPGEEVAESGGRCCCKTRCKRQLTALYGRRTCESSRTSLFLIRKNLGMENVRNGAGAEATRINTDQVMPFRRGVVTLVGD